MTRRFAPLAVSVALLCIAGTVFAGGGSEREPSQDTLGPITVASKIDTEGSLLGYMIIAVLQNAGFTTIDSVQMGPTDVVKRALESGEIDLYPEYTGNGAFFFDQAGSPVWKDADAGYARVAELDLAANGIVWLRPADANNTWAIAVRQELVDQGVVTMGDIGAFIASGGQFKLAASEEFVTREDVLPAFESTYGFDLTDENLLVFSGGNTATTIQAAARNDDGVNAAMAYGTDGQLAALGLTVLEDTAGVQPVYLPAPRVRGAVLEEYPQIADILNPVFESLDLQVLQSLNAAIGVEGRAAQTVAREYLEANGLLN